MFSFFVLNYSHQNKKMEQQFKYYKMTCEKKKLN
jgi:hypothetical protein